LITKVPLPAGSAIFASMRPESMGPLTGADRRTLQLLTRDLSAAIFLQSRLEASAADLAAGFMADLRIGAFFLDAGCRVTAMTALGETLLGEGDVVRLASRRLEAMNQEDDLRLQAAIAAVAKRERGAVEIVLGSAGVEGRARANVTRLPSAGPLGTFTFAVTVTRGAPRPSRLIEVGLTRSEAAIALALVDGDRPMDIALARGVSINTIRSQVREVYSKLGVTGVGSLARRVDSICGDPSRR
jgi:DNA-binding CsgD family transcriptional regulator